MTSDSRSLGIWSLVMISITSIVNLRNLPLMATMGYASVTFYLVAAVAFLIPSALITAELSAGWPKSGGVYLWVREAFGASWALLAIWSEWINNVVGFPATLSFIAVTLLYIVNPALIDNKLILISLVLLILWTATLINMGGVTLSSRVNSVGAVVGTIIPATLIIGMGFYWLLLGRPTQIIFSFDALIPDFQLSNLVFFVGVMSGYSGMQVTSFHVMNVKEPQKNFPRAVMLSVVIILATTILASLAIALIVPSNNISLAGGMMEGFQGFFSAFHMTWFVPIIAFFTALGGFSTLVSWLLGPARGLQTAAARGDYPTLFAGESKNGAPIKILIKQALVCTGLVFILLFSPSLSTAFWIFVVLTSQFTLGMFILVFAAAIKLRYSQPKHARPFVIPGKFAGIWLVSGLGILACGVAIIISFIPPAKLHIVSIWQYDGCLILGDILFLAVPFIIKRVMHDNDIDLESATTPGA